MSLLPGNISDFFADSNISFPNSVVSYLLLSKEETVSTTELSSSSTSSKPKIKIVVIDSKNIQDIKQTAAKVVKLVDVSFDLVSPSPVKLIRLYSNNSNCLVITDNKHILYTVID